MNELALFAGAGGGILGGKLLGWRTVCAVEINDYRRHILMQRQDDGILEPFPIWDDVRTFDGRPWRGIVDVVSGGFPCQDISNAGYRAGINGERSGLWFEMARIIREIRPRFVFVENAAALTVRGMDRVLGQLSELGFDAEWGTVGADAAGFCHRRARAWILANNAEECWQSYDLLEESKVRRASVSARRFPRLAQPQQWWPSHAGAECEPGLCGLAHGVANRVERLEAIGDGQVPAVAALAWRILSGDQP